MTDTALNTLPDTDETRSFADRARGAAASAAETVTGAASTAGERVSAAASTASSRVAAAANATVEAAKEHPYAAAGIAAGVAAAVAGGVYAATRFGEPARAAA